MHPLYRLHLLAGQEAHRTWQAGYGPYVPHPSTALPEERVASIVQELIQRLQCNYPFFHPAYAGQMVKPPHDLALVAYHLAQQYNPNNHALEGGPPTSELEKEVVQQLGRAFDFPDPCLGHLTTSGTLANLEALWVARELAPDKAIAYSASAHYTHSRMCQLLRVEGTAIATDAYDRMDVQALADRLENGDTPIGTVVVTLGTTGTGAVDPLKDILALCQPRGIRVHIDAAYGGFFYLLRGALPHSADWAALPQADSLVVDPHKHGLQPYGCGAVLFADPAVGRFYRHDSPYTYFSSDDLHLGEISLECSRAGAAAAALWATLQAFPLTAEGLGAVLAACRTAAEQLYAGLCASPYYEPVLAPTLDILTYYRIPTGLADLGRATEAIYGAGLAAAPEAQLHLSVFQAAPALFHARYPQMPLPQAPVPVLRSVLLKPEHALYAPELLKRLEALAQQVTA